MTPGYAGHSWHRPGAVCLECERLIDSWSETMLDALRNSDDGNNPFYSDDEDTLSLARQLADAVVARLRDGDMHTAANWRGIALGLRGALRGIAVDRTITTLANARAVAKKAVEDAENDATKRVLDWMVR